MSIIEIGIATVSGDTEGSVDVAVSVDGIDGEATLLPAEDGSGYASWGQPDHWISGPLLAYLRSLPGGGHATMLELATRAGREADALMGVR